MMELHELIGLQREFDQRHAGAFAWDKADLSFLLLCLMGELGELVNAIKKDLRAGRPVASSKLEIESECADLFIYLIKLCYELDIDIENAFLKKLKENEKRFAKYKKNTEKGR